MPWTFKTLPNSSNDSQKAQSESILWMNRSREALTKECNIYRHCHINNYLGWQLSSFFHVLAISVDCDNEEDGASILIDLDTDFAMNFLVGVFVLMNLSLSRVLAGHMCIFKTALEVCNLNVCWTKSAFHPLVFGSISSLTNYREMILLNLTPL